MSRTCRYCYSSVDDEHKFCTQCGREVPIPEYKETKNENVEKDNLSFDEIKNYDNKSENKSKNNNVYKHEQKKGFRIIIIVILFFSMLRLTIDFVGTNSPTKTIQQETSNYEPIKESSEIKTIQVTLEDKVNLLKEAKKDFDSKKYDDALPKYEKLVEVNYKPAESNYYLAEIWYMRKKYDVAINHFKKSAILNDKAAYMPTLLLHSAVSFENIKDKENAKSFYGTLIEIYPSSDEAKKAKEIIKPFNSKGWENNNKSNDIGSIKPTYKSDFVQPVVVSPAEQALPYNGEIRNYSYLEKVAPLNIKTSYGANYLVKLKGAYNKEPIMTVFIVGGNEITINVPLGSFEITYASGNKWYGYDYLFGKETSYSKADEIFNFRDTGYEISGYTITLYRVSNGNLNTQNINQSQF